MKYAKGEESAPLQQPGRESEGGVGRAGGTPEAAEDHVLLSWEMQCSWIARRQGEKASRQPWRR